MLAHLKIYEKMSTLLFSSKSCIHKITHNLDFTDGVTSYIVQKKVRSDIKKILMLGVTLYISVYEHGGHTVYECIIYTV